MTAPMHDRVARPVPGLAWLLVAAAGIQLGAYVAHNWYRFFGPFPIVRLDDVLAATQLVAPFLIAAAAVVAAPRWPAGRRWIVAGVVLLAVHGAITSIDAAWWAWFPPVSAPSPGEQAFLVTLSLVNVVVAVAAPACLAVGIGGAAPARAPTSAGQRVAVAAIGLGVVVGVALGVRLLVLEMGVTQDMAWWHGPLAFIFRVLTTLVVVAFGLLAAAAVRTAPFSHPLPELVVALGAVLVAGGQAIGWHLQWLTFERGTEAAALIPYQLPAAVIALGYLFLMVGFALAAVPRSEARLAQPISRAAAVARWWRGRRGAA